MNQDLTKSQIELLTTDKDVGKRLDVFLSELEQVESRSLATKMIQAGLISSDTNKTLKSSTKLEANWIIRVTLPDAKETELVPYDYPLDIVYEDSHLFVINKPAGLVVHPAAGHANDTLVNALIHYSQDFHIGLDERRPGIVHRLDKDTSGLIVVAKDNKSLEKLAEDFSNRTITRYYWAVVMGCPKFSEHTIESSIGRHVSNRKKMSSKSKQAKFAKTDIWKLSDYHEKLSLMKFKLHTGRTHQIRVHCSENHFPILGDELYVNWNSAKNLLSNKQIADLKSLERFFLHAAILGFEHPITKEYLEFYSAPPKELISSLEKFNFIDTIEKEFRP